jgi:uncharacterized protein
MKYVLILAIVLAVLWLVKNKRRLDSDESAVAQKPRKNTPAIATEIVACDVCHVHLPRSEALTGPKGVYCSAAHRQQAGAG